MSNNICPQYSQNPAYSGITINITNPSLHAGPCHPNCNHNHPPIAQNNQPAGQMNIPVTNPGQTAYMPNSQNYSNGYNTNPVGKSENIQQSYPPQYYLNNYNYVQNGSNPVSQTGQNPTQAPQNIDQNIAGQIASNENPQEPDLSTSKEIINELDARVAEQKELEKNGTKTKVVALTNEYIKSLENYLNNPNSEIRLMASKEILTRLNEDRERYDDAALNALLNKMLQDPNKLVRIAALSAFASELASGNDFTVKLLKDIQSNPNADKEDVLQAADILLKMSSTKEVKYIPQNQSTNTVDLTPEGANEEQVA